MLTPNVPVEIAWIRGVRLRDSGCQTIPWKGKIFVGILPIFNHTIMDAENARKCGDCHNNDAVKEYREEGKIWVARWDEDNKSMWLRKGVEPLTHEQMLELMKDYSGSESNEQE